MNRLTGRDITITLSTGDGTRTLKFDSAEADLVLEPAKTTHPLFVPSDFKIEFTAVSNPGWARFVEALGKHARESALNGLVAHILAGGWLGKLVVSEHGWFITDIQRIEVAATDPSKRVIRSIHCYFDMKNDPRTSWLSRGGHLYDPPTPEELRRSFSTAEPCKRPILGVSWVAMDVGPSGYVDTIIIPKPAVVG